MMRFWASILLAAGVVGCGNDTGEGPSKPAPHKLRATQENDRVRAELDAAEDSLDRAEEQKSRD